MVKQNHPDLNVRRQCSLLSLSRSSLYYHLCGESAENLAFMEVIHCPAGAFKECCRKGTGSSRKRPSTARGKRPATCSERGTNAGATGSDG